MSSRVIGTFLRDALGQPQKQIVYGEVSLSQPAPSSFASPLYVVMPDWSIDFYHTVAPGNWFACHGSTLPQPGASCLLIFDNQGTLTCPMWSSATTTFVPTGFTETPLTVASGTPRLYGPYDTGVLGGAGITPNGDVSTTVTHSLGTTSLTAWGHLYDGFFSALAGWRVAFPTSNTVEVHIGTTSSRTNITAGLKFWLIG